MTTNRMLHTSPSGRLIAVIAALFHSAPIYINAARTVFESIDARYERAARTLGASEIRTSLQNAIARWQRRAENPLSSRDVADASRVLIRTCEGLLVDAA